MNDAAGTWSRAPAEQPSASGVPDPAPVTAAGARERMTLPAVPLEAYRSSLVAMNSGRGGSLYLVSVVAPGARRRPARDTHGGCHDAHAE